MKIRYSDNEFKYNLVIINNLILNLNKLTKLSTIDYGYRGC